MKPSFKNLARRGILFLFLIGLSETSFSQAFVFGNSPSYTALNMKNKKPLDTVLLEVRYQFTWTYANNSQPHTEQRTLLIGRNHIYSRNEALYQNDSVATSLITIGCYRIVVKVGKKTNGFFACHFLPWTCKCINLFVISTFSNSYCLPTCAF